MFVNVEESKIILMTTKRLLSLILTTTFLISCNQAIDGEVYGNWAVFDVYYGDKDISGIEKESKVVFSNSMTIDKSQGIISLPSDLGDNEYGHIKAFRRNNRDWLKIYNATDVRFNGEYLIHLNKQTPINRGRNKKYTIELESELVYIYGEKTVVSL